MVEGANRRVVDGWVRAPFVVQGLPGVTGRLVGGEGFSVDTLLLLTPMPIRA